MPILSYTHKYVLIQSLYTSKVQCKKYTANPLLMVEIALYTSSCTDGNVQLKSHSTSINI